MVTKENPDGSVSKQVTFEHKGFVEVETKPTSDADKIENDIGSDLDGSEEEDAEGDAVDNDSDNIENESARRVKMPERVEKPVQKFAKPAMSACNVRSNKKHILTGHQTIRHQNWLKSRRNKHRGWRRIITPIKR